MIDTKKKKFNNFIVIIIFIDILFLPFLKVITMPLSLPVLAILILLKKIEVRLDKELLVFSIISLLVLVSSLISFLQTPQYFDDLNLWRLNFLRGFQLITSFIYYFSLKRTLINSSINIKKIMWIFIAFYILLGVIAYTDLALFFRIRDIWGLSYEEWLIHSTTFTYRYSYLWGDPNNAAYAFQMVVFYMLSNEDLNLSERIIIYIALLISIIFSMSSGALISALIYFIIYGLSRFTGLNSFRIKFRIKDILLLIASFFLVIIIAWIFRDSFLNIRHDSLARISSNDASAETRIRIYQFILSESRPNLIGEGYTIIRNGRLVRPHSDHFRFAYSYGIVVYLMALWFFFRKAIYNSKYLFLIPGFMAFTINSLIEEQKILLVLMMLIAATNYKILIKKINIMKKGEEL